jgi:hypothetical protein
LSAAVDITIETTERSPGKLNGVVIEAVNGLPMSGTRSRPELTCSCPLCEKFIKDRNQNLLARFKTFPNPWNLLLRAIDTSIHPIYSIRVDYGPQDVVGLSRLKGFHEVFDDQTMPFMLEQATILLPYIRIRHDQMIASLNAIFEQALHGLESPLSRVLLSEGVYYD